MASPDPLDTILTLLSNNWNSANTNSLTPKFIKITDKKRYDYRENQDLILIHRSPTITTPAGIGNVKKHEEVPCQIDVRVFGADQEQHWIDVIEEVKRIVDSNKISPSADYLVLEYNGQGQDLSDGAHNRWRHLIPVQLERYNVQR